MSAVSLLLMALVVAIGLLGATWAFLVTTIEQPYHEMWIGLNNRLPDPLRAWSRHTVFARIGGGLPPYGCDGLWK